VEAAERHADGAATRQELAAALARVSRDRRDAEANAADPFLHASRYCRAVARLNGCSGLVRQGLCAPVDQASLVREVIGNPFRPAAADPAWLAWSDGTVVKLAQAAYEDRDLPSGYLDPTRLAVLADALEDAGCSAPDILAHLRSVGPHVRGCWAVDLLLGKE
jgi:hypothetical protein